MDRFRTVRLVSLSSTLRRRIREERGGKGRKGEGRGEKERGEEGKRGEGRGGEGER